MEGADAAVVVRLLGGQAPWAEIRAHTSIGAVRRSLAAGDLRRVSRGNYALPELPQPVQLARATGGLLSHDSAAAHWRLPMVADPTHVHLTIPRKARRKPRRDVVFHHSDLGAADEAGIVTSPCGRSSTALPPCRSGRRSPSPTRPSA